MDRDVVCRALGDVHNIDGENIQRKFTNSFEIRTYEAKVTRDNDSNLMYRQ